MEEKNSLRKFLLGRFFLTLLIVGIMQAIINIAMKSMIMPSVENMLGLTGVFTGKSLTECIRIFVSCILVVTLRMAFGSGGMIERVLTTGFLSQILGGEQVRSLLVINDKLDDTRIVFEAISVVLFFIFLLVIWLLPYALGAFSYTKAVSAKVNELEKKRIDREKDYISRRNLILSDITHDIKTPITTIVGFSKALSDGTVKEGEETEYLSAIYNKSMVVSDLVSLLFEYIKLDSKGYKLNRTRVDISEILRECVAFFYAEFESKNMELTLDIPENEIFVSADKMQLERAINNILSNTIKYNPDNTPVEISLTQEKTQAIIRISDCGIRIEKEDAVHLFEPFVRADKSRKSGNGSGLGLSITKKIIDMHGGRVYLIQYKDQEVNKKVKTFEIKLPCDI